MPARSLALGVGLAALALVLYVGARETSVFAVRTIQVRGAPQPLARRVETALAPLEGKSLLSIDGGQVTRLATALPGVAGVRYDRAFPNTLRVEVEPEVPLAVVRRGVEAWLVARSGRVLARIPQGTHRPLPRIWLPKSVQLTLGRTLPGGAASEDAAALALATGSALGSRVASVRVTDGQDVFVLHGGTEIRVGAPTDLALKLAVAAQILARTPIQGYLDVSVVERPVAGGDPQVSG